MLTWFEFKFLIFFFLFGHSGMIATTLDQTHGLFSSKFSDF